MTHCPRCGKDNPAEIHTCTPRALVLAGALESGRPVTGSAAEELRRLHAENEAKDALLRQAKGALVLAKYAIEEWGSYASKYFQQKYDLVGDIAATDEAITAIRARLSTGDN